MDNLKVPRLKPLEYSRQHASSRNPKIITDLHEPVLQSNATVFSRQVAQSSNPMTQRTTITRQHAESRMSLLPREPLPEKGSFHYDPIF